MAKYRRYTEDEKATALAFLAANRGNYKATARQTGVPLQTLYSWDKGVGVSTAVSENSEQKRGDLAEALEKKIWLMLDGIEPDKIGTAQVNQLTTGVGTFIDKVQLLRGKPTSINGEDTSARDTLKRKLASIASRTPAATVPPKPD